MRSQLLKAILICAFVSVLRAFVSGQTIDGINSKSKPASSSNSLSTNPVLNLAGKVTVVIIKSAAKTAWETTKFAAKDVAKPIIVGIAKPLLLKATPQITIFALKLTSNSLKKGIPIATKLGMTYLRAKLPI